MSRPPWSRPPLPEAPLTCKLLQGVTLLQFPGDLGVRQDFLAHGRQHHRGVHGVYPDLGPRGRRRRPQGVDEPLCPPAPPHLRNSLTVFSQSLPRALDGPRASPMPSAAPYHCQPLPLLPSPPLCDPQVLPSHAHLVWPQLCCHGSGEYTYCALGGACGGRAALRTPQPSAQTLSPSAQDLLMDGWGTGWAEGLTVDR